MSTSTITSRCCSARTGTRRIAGASYGSLLAARYSLLDTRMRANLSWNRYGKSRVRLVKVHRGPDSHDLIDLTIDVSLEGAFERVYVEGDNSGCLATDTMKNTVYAFARQDPIDHVEPFATRL